MFVFLIKIVYHFRNCIVFGSNMMSTVCQDEKKAMVLLGGINYLHRIVKRSKITQVFRASSIVNSPRLVATKRHFLLRFYTSGLAYIQEEEVRLQKVRRGSSVLSVQGDAGNIYHL